MLNSRTFDADRDAMASDRRPKSLAYLRTDSVAQNPFVLVHFGHRQRRSKQNGSEHRAGALVDPHTYETPSIGVPRCA